MFDNRISFTMYVHKVTTAYTVADPGFPRGGGANSPGGGANIRFCHIFPKTAWNWKNLGPRGRGRASLAPPPLDPPLLQNPQERTISHFQNGMHVKLSAKSSHGRKFHGRSHLQTAKTTLNMLTMFMYYFGSIIWGKKMHADKHFISITWPSCLANVNKLVKFLFD